MRRFIWIPVFLCLAPIPARADDAAEAGAVLDKAIKAVGGADALKKHQGMTWKSSGAFYAEEKKITFTDDWSAHAYDKFRWNLTFTVEGVTISGAIGLNGAKGWAQANGKNVDEVPKDVIPLLANEFQVLRAVDLLTPLTEKPFTLSHLGELKINDKPAVGIKAANKMLPEVDLYFDKDTNLPVRCEFRVKELERSDECLHSYYFSEYKEIDGRKHFTKLILKRDDKLFMESERTEIKLEEKIDDAVFAKP